MGLTECSQIPILCISGVQLICNIHPPPLRLVHFTESQFQYGSGIDWLGFVIALCVLFADIVF